VLQHHSGRLLPRLLHCLVRQHRHPRERHHGPGLDGTVHGGLRSDQVHHRSPRKGAPHLEGLRLRRLDRHLHPRRRHRRPALPQQPPAHQPHRPERALLPGRTLPVDDLRPLPVHQHLHAQAQETRLRTQVELGVRADLRGAARSGGNRLHTHSGLLRVPAIEVQVHQRFQHGGVRLPDDDDQRPDLQLGDHQARAVRQVRHQGQAVQQVHADLPPRPLGEDRPHPRQRQVPQQLQMG
jgi:hypothetical protein